MPAEDEGGTRRTPVTIEPRAVSLETAAAMFEWSTGRFDRWRRRHGVDYAPGSHRFLVADIDAAIQRWRRAGASPAATTGPSTACGLPPRRPGARLSGHPPAAGPA